MQNKYERGISSSQKLKEEPNKNMNFPKKYGSFHSPKYCIPTLFKKLKHITCAKNGKHMMMARFLGNRENT